MNKFDATVDFSDEGALDAELLQAYNNIGADDSQILVAHIPADGEDCEQGELQYLGCELAREVKEDDFYVTGNTIQDLVAKLRELV